MIQLVAAFSAKVEVLQFTPAGLSLPVPAQKPTVPPTHAMFGLDFSQVIPDTENAC
jgi:hypothetical protein